MDPVLQFRQASLDVLSVAERAALAAQQELVEELDVDESEDLLEELSDQELGHVCVLHELKQTLHEVDDRGPVGAQGRASPAGLLVSSACRTCPWGVDAVVQSGSNVLLDVVPQQAENLLHECVELLLEQEGRVLCLHLLLRGLTPRVWHGGP